MKSFRELTKEQNESAVGMVGRTKDTEAEEHIENSDLAKEFKKIVKKLGGKNVARQLLAGMNIVIPKAPKADVVIGEGKQTIEDYLRDVGFKIKSEEATKSGKEIEFFKKGQAEEAFEDLKSAGFGKDFDLSLAHTIITYS